MDCFLPYGLILQNASTIWPKALNKFMLFFQNNVQFNLEMQQEWTLHWKQQLLVQLAVPWVSLESMENGGFWYLNTDDYLDHLQFRTETQSDKHSQSNNPNFHNFGASSSSSGSSVHLKNRIKIFLHLETHQLQKIEVVVVGNQPRTNVVHFNLDTVQDIKASLLILDQAFEAIQQIYDFYVVRFVYELQAAFQETIIEKMLISNNHPLFTILKHLHDSLNTLKNSVKRTEIQPIKCQSYLTQRQKDKVLQEIYWDVRQRISSRLRVTPTQAISNPPPKIRSFRRNEHYNSQQNKRLIDIPTDQYLTTRTSTSEIIQQFDNKNTNYQHIHLSHDIYRKMYYRRDYIEDYMLKQFQQLNLSTNHNIQFKVWSEAMEQRLGFQSNFTKKNSQVAWPYRMLCMIADVIELLSEFRHHFNRMNADFWQGCENDDVGKAIHRMFQWSIACNNNSAPKSAETNGSDCFQQLLYDIQALDQQVGTSNAGLAPHPFTL